MLLSGYSMNIVKGGDDSPSRYSDHAPSIASTQHVAFFFERL